MRGRFGGWADVDGGPRTVTDLPALLSTLLSPLPDIGAAADGAGRVAELHVQRVAGPMQGREISNSGQEWPIALLIINRSLDLVQPMITSDPLGQDGSMAKIPTSTQTSLWQRLTSHARRRWPQVTEVQTRYRAGFAYIDAVLADGEPIRLCRLRYGGSAHG